MASLLNRYFTDRFIKPQVDAQVSAILKSTTPPLAYGISSIPDISLKDSVGQPPDSDYNLLYANYRVNAGVANCIKLIVGGVVSEGWKLALMDPDATPTGKQQKDMDALTLWLKNPNPSKRFSLLLSEAAYHILICGDSYWSKNLGTTKPIQELWSVHPSTMRVKSDQYGVIAGYVQLANGQRVEFKPEEVTHLRLPNPISDLYGRSPLRRLSVGSCFRQASDQLR